MKTYKQIIEEYAQKNYLEIVFSEGHQYFDRIFYDVREGKYYDRLTDLFLNEDEIKNFK